MFNPLSHTVRCYALWGVFAILCHLKKCLKLWAAHQEMQFLRHDSHLWLLPSASVPSSGDSSVIFLWSTSPSPLSTVLEVWVEGDYGGKESSSSMGRDFRAL